MKCPVCKSKKYKEIKDNNGVMGPGNASWTRYYQCEKCGVLYNSTKTNKPKPKPKKEKQSDPNFLPDSPLSDLVKYNIFPDMIKCSTCGHIHLRGTMCGVCFK